jgi:serine/threonine protein kinase
LEKPKKHLLETDFYHASELKVLLPRKLSEENPTQIKVTKKNPRALLIIQKVDSYSFAYILYELFTGKDPFEGWTMLQYSMTVEGKRPTLSQEWFQGIEKIYRLILACWQTDPIKRPDFHQIVLELSSLQVTPVGEKKILIFHRVKLREEEEVHLLPRI